MDIRNIAIIAHVDHGKTTLVDWMLKQTHTFRDNQAEMTQTTILDSNDLEREKGITILAKNTSVFYRDTKINIIDTPGHADFSGEVERVINMADGALLIIDAAEGPLPQTRFVLEKAFEHNLKVIVVINKIDRKDARPAEILTQTEDLFLQLAHHERHLTFPVIYAVGREGKAWRSYPTDMQAEGSLAPLFEEIIRSIPGPQTKKDAPFKMLVSTLDFDPHKGVFAIGKVTQGTVAPRMGVLLTSEKGSLGSYRIEQVFTSRGLQREEVSISAPGDIIAVTGIPTVAIGTTITDPKDPAAIATIAVESPTLKIVLSANTSPFAGREGKFCTARQIHERLTKEQKTNIGIEITPNPQGTGFVVAGRGELHLAVLLENLRREGYEMQVGKPEVIMKEVDAVKSEPFEEMTIEIENSFVGVIAEELGRRKAQLVDTHTNESGVTRMVYTISSRNLLGFRGDILTKTRGNGLFASRFTGYFPLHPTLSKLRNGVLVAIETGTSTGYALTTVQERGRAFIRPGTPVYEGMIVGINNRAEDIDVNVCKTKKLTNVHSANADIAIQLDPPLVLTLEQCLDFIEADELVEITPRSLRLRKIHLSKNERNRAGRK